MTHLHERDTTIAVVSRAPIEKIERCNYRSAADGRRAGCPSRAELHGTSVFLRIGDGSSTLLRLRARHDRSAALTTTST